MTTAQTRKLKIGAGLLLLLLLTSKTSKAGSLSSAQSVLRSFLPSWESFRANPYWDAKQWSWGYGTRVPGSVDNPNIAPGGSITPGQAITDMLSALSSLYNYLLPLVTRALNSNQWAAYLSFGYNTGPGNADNLIPNINAGNWQALETEWKLYTLSNGVRLQSLADRRAAEWKLFTS